MEKGNFVPVLAGITNVLTAVSGVLKNVKDEEEKQTAIRAAVLEHGPGLMEAWNGLLLNPTKEEIALLSSQLRIVCLFVSVAGKDTNMADVFEINRVFQGYLRFKAEAMEDNEKVLALIDANIK